MHFLIFLFRSGSMASQAPSMHLSGTASSGNFLFDFLPCFLPLFLKFNQVGYGGFEIL